MELGEREEIVKVWRQEVIPVIYRQGKGFPLLVKLPNIKENHFWLQNSKRSEPVWDRQYKCWETPKAWFNELVKRLLMRFGKLYIVQPYREQEKCAPACMNAVGHECQCSCMGVNHGSHSSSNDWLIVSDAFATRWGEKELAGRLMERANS